MREHGCRDYAYLEVDNFTWHFFGGEVNELGAFDFAAHENLQGNVDYNSSSGVAKQSLVSASGSTAPNTGPRSHSYLPKVTIN